MCKRIQSEPGKIAKKQIFKEYLQKYPQSDREIVLKIFLGEVNPRIGVKQVNINQATLFTNNYTIHQIYDILLQLTNSRTDNEVILTDLFNSIPVDQLPFIKKILLGNINIGIGETLILEALSEFYGRDIKSDYYICPHISEVLNNHIMIQPHVPIRAALAKQGTKFPTDYSIEYKYDGFRFQFHKAHNQWRIFSRKLEDYSYRLQKVGNLLFESLPDNIIIDGELVTSSMNFQEAIRIDAELTPVIFDILYLNTPTIHLPYIKRREILESLNSPFVDQRWTNESIDDLFNEAISLGYEGIMVKDLYGLYEPVVRHWIKVKPGQDTLDLVVTGAEHGLGKREGLYGSLILGCLQNGNITDICKVGTGFSDAELKRWKYLLDTSNPTPTKEGISVEPRYVIEIGHSGFQASPTYACGKSVRFPVYIRQRSDKPISEIFSL